MDIVVFVLHIVNLQKTHQHKKRHLLLYVQASKNSGHYTINPNNAQLKG